MNKEDNKPNLSKISKKSSIINPVQLKDAHAVGKRIKDYRERLGLEQKVVAREVGITPNAVSN